MDALYKRGLNGEVSRKIEASPEAGPQSQGTSPKGNQEAPVKQPISWCLFGDARRQEGLMSACYCDDGDAPSVYNRETRKARKAHQCWECAHTIESGEAYEYVSGIWDGSPGSYKTCADCVEFRAWFEAHIPCVCWSHGAVFEIAIDEAHEYDHECPGFHAETVAKYRSIRAKRRPWVREKVEA